MLSSPTTYSEWVDLFELLKNKSNDGEVCIALKTGVFEWQKDISNRFMQKLLDAVNSRFNEAVYKLQNDISQSQDQEIALIQALNTCRKEMIFLHDILDLPVIPKKDRVQYRTLFWGRVDKIQSVLEDMANADRSGKMLNLFRGHAVNKDFKK
jgi:hypothetical protein